MSRYKYFTLSLHDALPIYNRHVNYDAVSPNYFSTMRVPLLAGREFNAGDTATNTKVAIINEAMAKEFFSNRNPIGVDRKSTRLNSSHRTISYAVFCLKKNT